MKNKNNMIQTEFIQTQNYVLQREVLVNRNSTWFKSKNQSNNIIAPNKDKSFEQMPATDEITSQPESIIKTSQYKRKGAAN